MKKTTKIKKKDGEELVLRNQLVRALADYDNLKRRVERDRETFEKVANLRLVIKLLPVLDILKQAQGHLKDQGVAITIKEFEDALKAEGVEELIVNPGDEFNPDLHEVVEVVPGKENNIISELVLSGWKFINGPVVRHAKVKVTQKEEN